jgi:hypothetical protein
MRKGCFIGGGRTLLFKISIILAHSLICLQFCNSISPTNSGSLSSVLRLRGAGAPVRTRSVIERTGSLIAKKDLVSENVTAETTNSSGNSNATGEKSSNIEEVQTTPFALHEAIVARRYTKLDDFYKIDYAESGVLGTGTFSTVRIGTCRLTGVKYAIKAISLADIQPQTLVRLRREIQVLRSLRHHNIIRLHEIFEEEVNGSGVLHMVTELCTGGELWHFLQKVEIFPDGEKFYYSAHGRVELTEYKVASIIRGVVEAIAYCHARRVCHRDLKLENLMLSTTGDNAEVKLIDFGFCKIFNNMDGMYAILGSPYYVAPEILKAKAPSASGSRGSGYGPAADMWSIGVITYMILCGQAPFDGETDQARLTAVRRGVFTYPGHANLSPEAVSFIDGLLTVDPYRRLDAVGALQHPWLRSVKAANRPGWGGCLQAPEWTPADLE